MKLSKSLFKSIFLMAFISILITFFASIILQYQEYQKDSLYVRTSYIDTQKEITKLEVEKVIHFINYKQKLIEEETRELLKDRVTQAYNIAMSIYNENRDIKTTEEIKYLIVTSLKNISFHNKRAYYFINNNNGTAVLFNTQSKLGLNINNWDLQDKNGNYIARRQSKIANTKGSGFVLNQFVKPDKNDGIQYPKLTYVKMFEPFDWHIGIGEYLDDMESDLKNELLSWIETIRYRKSGYVFVNTNDGFALVFDGKKLKKPKNRLKDTLYKDILKISKNKDGGFHFYEFKKLNTKELFPKMAYVKEYKKWNWIIGTGIYIDEIEEEIQRKKEQLKSNIIDQFYIISLFLLLFSIVIYFVSKRISSFMNSNIDYLIESFSKAARDYKEVDLEQLTFKEFKSLAKSLNKTLKSRNNVENQLSEHIHIVNENIIISTTDKFGIITNVSKAFCDISGYNKDELFGRSHDIIRHPDTPKEIFKDMWIDIKSGKTWSGELKNKTKIGGFYFIKVNIHPNYKNNDIIGYTAISIDITDKKRIELLSITDDLTNLYNRRYFNNKIVQELNRSKRDNKFICFMMIDVDYFKKYNDSYGHQAGDKVLKEVAKSLKDNANRASDFVFRLGGEEFGVIFSDTNDEKSLEFANSIKKSIENLKIEHKASTVGKYLTVSIGLVVRDAKNITNDDHLYKLADDALYKAKEEGRNQVIVIK